MIKLKKLPNGISNYEELIRDGYIYVDKTNYIEKLENLTDKRIMFLRPRKFGKTLFTSVLENYYDIQKADLFDTLFGNTYIGKHPTVHKNSYYILRFNFSGIGTTAEENTIKGFKEEVSISIGGFVAKYGLDFYCNPELTAEGLFSSLLEAFKNQRIGEKIYVIIDEYDHFANELLGFHTDQFKSLVSKNGKVRKWYEILKKGTESVVDRIFITGVAPITLDSLTSGFNISKDITLDTRFNEMMGFTKNELIELMDSQQISKENQKMIMPIMKEYYDGYKFSIDSKEQMYNSNMCLYFLSDYIGLEKIPSRLVDVNIASDYSKLGKMLTLCKSDKALEIIEDTVSGNGISSEITEKFNPAMDFTEKDLISMLFYLGYLTIVKEEFGYPLLAIPNKVMKEIYSEYFLQYLKNLIKLDVEEQYTQIAKEIAKDGKIDILTNLVKLYLTNLSNRDFIKFDEKHLKLIYYCICMNVKLFRVKSEMEVHQKYPDLLLIPKEKLEEYYGVMIEFKYLKKENKNKLDEKKEEAKKQIEEYSRFEEIKAIPKLKKYTVVAINGEIFVDEVD